MILEAPTAKKVREILIQQLLRQKHNTDHEVLNPFKKRSRNKKSKTSFKKTIVKYYISNNSIQINSKEINFASRPKRSDSFNLSKKGLIKEYKSRKKKN